MTFILSCSFAPLQHEVMLPRFRATISSPTKGTPAGPPAGAKKWEGKSHDQLARWAPLRSLHQILVRDPDDEGIPDGDAQALRKVARIDLLDLSICF